MEKLTSDKFPIGIMVFATHKECPQDKDLGTAWFDIQPVNRFDRPMQEEDSSYRLFKCRGCHAEIYITIGVGD